ncbi:hypothetical protein EXU57_23200 [Segetibacter sp. 3557_3]|uniref:hypothetical protein n=1 Tax=Segetibacter sp. 3557_3 TaxID=2547429 RepID=UPI0010591778|nr:hypothetical protein [Segetibacter sp. 3557_3]TDH18507.1 hypothetical protein EXU57_23200 [Segetibacter sp. 3557_3]
MRKGSATLISKAEGQYLIKRAAETFELDPEGEKVDFVKKNPTCFDKLAAKLQGIVRSNEYFVANYNGDSRDKYDITGVQLRDLYHVPREVKRVFDATLDALYLFIWDVPRKNFLKEMKDEKLTRIIKEAKDKETNTLDAVEQENENLRQKVSTLEQANQELSVQISALEGEQEVSKQKGATLEEANQELRLQISALKTEQDLIKKKIIRKSRINLSMGILLVGLLITFTFFFLRWETIKKDFNILPYKASKEQLAILEGNWLVHAPSPQVRTILTDRYHKVVSNFVHFTSKNGYLTFERYGPGFKQTGVLQFVSDSVVSIYAKTVNRNHPDTVESPKYSILTIRKGSPYQVAISATWNFDPDEKNIPIASREVYRRLGEGDIEVQEKTKETSACGNCSFIHWKKRGKNTTDTVRLESLESLPIFYQKHLDENSILLRHPNEVPLATPL